jgi:hypothetical protein
MDLVSTSSALGLACSLLHPHCRHCTTRIVDTSSIITLPGAVRARGCTCRFWGLRFSYGVMHGGSDADMLADKGQKVNMGQQYVGSMCHEVFESLGQMIGMVEQVAYLTGKTARVSELLEVLDELDEAAGHPSGEGEGGADSKWSYAPAEMTRVGSTLNSPEADAELAAAATAAGASAGAGVAELPASGPIPASWSPRFGTFGSQTAQSSVAKDRAGGNYATAGTWWRRLQREGPQQWQSATVTAGEEASLRFEDVDVVRIRKRNTESRNH